MDGAHLTLAVCGFVDAGIEDIAVIHDSFGTYAADTGKLRKVLLDSFVDMYQQNDVLNQFASYNEERMCEVMEVEVPLSLGLDLEQVRHSTYAFAP
jgi:DNA-directed RNA polymerase